MKILFEDKDIVACVKDAGLPTEAPTGETVISLLEKREESPKIFPVHRLDRETTGIMVFAKNQASAASLSKQITEDKFRKKYFAVISGCPEEKEGEFFDYLFRDKQKNKTFVVRRERKGVRDAKLHYEVVERKNDFSLVDILLYTGRTHQIRVQFASRKMPILGDGKYGGRKNDRLCLFAYHLEFDHPKTGEELIFDEKDSALEMWKNINE